LLVELTRAIGTLDDLLCRNDDELRRVHDEFQRRLWHPSVAADQHMVDADRRRWDFSIYLERSPNQDHRNLILLLSLQNEAAWWSLLLCFVAFAASPTGDRRPAPKGAYFIRVCCIRFNSQVDFFDFFCYFFSLFVGK
jgi:hypothetical protein